MKVDWKARYKAEVAATRKLNAALAEEFEFVSWAVYDIKELDFGSAKSRLQRHLPKIAQLLGVEYCDYFAEEVRK